MGTEGSFVNISIFDPMKRRNGSQGTVFRIMRAPKVESNPTLFQMRNDELAPSRITESRTSISSTGTKASHPPTHDVKHLINLEQDKREIPMRTIAQRPLNGQSAFADRPHDTTIAGTAPPRVEHSSHVDERPTSSVMGERSALQPSLAIPPQVHPSILLISDRMSPPLPLSQSSLNSIWQQRVATETQKMPTRSHAAVVPMAPGPSPALIHPEELLCLPACLFPRLSAARRAAPPPACSGAHASLHATSAVSLRFSHFNSRRRR
jgi:hypothetical protein